MQVRHSQVGILKRIVRISTGVSFRRSCLNIKCVIVVLQLLENMKIGIMIVSDKSRFPLRLLRRVLITEDRTQLVSRLILHLMQLFKLVQNLINQSELRTASFSPLAAFIAQVFLHFRI